MMRDAHNGDDGIAVSINDRENDGARPILDALLVATLELRLPEIGIANHQARLRRRQRHAQPTSVRARDAGAAGRPRRGLWLQDRHRSARQPTGPREPDASAAGTP